MSNLKAPLKPDEETGLKSGQKEEGYSVWGIIRFVLVLPLIILSARAASPHRKLSCCVDWCDAFSGALLSIIFFAIWLVLLPIKCCCPCLCLPQDSSLKAAVAS